MFIITYLLASLLIASTPLSPLGTVNQTSNLSQPSFSEPVSENSSSITAPIISNETNIEDNIVALGTINVDAEDPFGNNIPSCDEDISVCQSSFRSITFKWLSDGVSFVCLPDFSSHEQIANIEFPCSSPVKFNSVSAGVNKLEIFGTNSAGQRIFGRFTWIVNEAQNQKELVLALESRADSAICF